MANDNKKEAGMEYINCPLCGVDDTKVLARRGYQLTHIRNVICRRCGLIYINPRMTKEEYKKFYEKEFFSYLNPYERPAYVQEIEDTIKENISTPTKERLIPFIIDYVPQGGDVLDVGAGFGNALYLLVKAKGARATGLEPNPESRKITKEKMGIELLPDTIEGFLEKPSERKYDLIILNQTLEHLLEPLEVLKKLAQRLKLGGAMYIGVPNAYNPQIPIVSKTYSFFQIAHTFNYTPHTMKLMTERAGLKIIKMRNETYYPLEVIAARKDASYHEVAPERLRYGSDPMEVVRRLRRKHWLNISRGIIKRVLGMLIGEKLTNRLRDRFDSLIHYRY